MNICNILLDVEKDLREAEGCLSVGLGSMNCVKDENWFACMEELGFLVSGKFLPLLDILGMVHDLPELEKVFTLEAVACNLSLVYKGLHDKGDNNG